MRSAPPPASHKPNSRPAPCATHAGRNSPFVAGCALALVIGLGAGARLEAHESFATPEDAATGLAQALQKGDAAALNNLFGPGAETIVSSGDPVDDASDRAWFVARYNEKHSLVPDGADKVELQVGPDSWPLPTPIVRRSGRWFLDGASGAEELLYRRIGGNELGAIRVCRGYVDAQIEYASVDRDGEGNGVYAQKLRSDPGTRNGLYWETAAGDPPSPVGAFIANAGAEGYRAASGTNPSYHGYRYRSLFRQTKNANGGAVEYFVDGELVNGFALVAWPAQYGVSGVMTFIVNQDGVVFQKDLGADTAKVVDKMNAYDPGSSWVAIVAADDGQSQ